MTTPASPMQVVAYAPLLPIAAAATIGLVADRYLHIPIPLSLASTLLCLIAWMVCRQRKRDQLALIYQWACWVGIAAAYHHASRNLYAVDDIGEFAQDEPALVRVHGTLAEEPVVQHRRKDDPLVSVPRTEPVLAVLQVAEIEQEDRWVPASGNAQLQVEGKLELLHVGDEIEATGWLSRPLSPMNPGEADFAARLLDRRIRAILRVRKNEDGVVRVLKGWPDSFFGWLAVVRGHGQRTIQQTVPPAESGVASALLLGEGSTMTSDDWDRYVRTGVIHVLAISGQHLVVLGGFIWFWFRLLGVRRRRVALLVAAFLLAYALLTGGQPSAMRSAVMVGAVSAGIILRRPTLPASTFCLAWLVVLALNPTDLFTAGFQLSFLCVAVLIWGLPRWFPRRPASPLEQLIDESRPGWVRFLRSSLRIVGQMYLITLTLEVFTAPLVMYWQNVFSPAGVLIGPPAIFLTSIALISGFLLLLTGPFSAWLAWPFAWATQQSIAACEWIVRLADHMRGGCWYLPNIPVWWVIGLYAGLIGWMLAVRLKVGSEPVERSERFTPIIRPAAFAAFIGGWLALGLLSGAFKPAADDLRVSFVAVGHGGCILMETPDGRVFLYDAGSLSGPEVTRRHIAPFLWSRGISRIDEVFISHADLDHFNGLPALADRFVIGRITLTPTFEKKLAPGVAFVMQDLRRRGIAIREAKAGEEFTAGDVDLRVIHPPEEGPEGVENARSMVLLVEHQGHRFLFTGDLELKGLECVLDQPPARVHVLMAPHHGSPAANQDRLADWAAPRIVVACDGPRPLSKAVDAYTRKKIPYWVTWPHGTITFRSHRTGLIAETFRTGQRVVVVAGGER